MATLLYIHGFLSSPQSYKARATAQWLANHRPDINFLCPQLSSYPDEAVATLQAQLEEQKPQNNKIMLIGSSLGGFWATWLAEHYVGIKAVLINPAVAPQNFVKPLIGKTLKSYYGEAMYCLQPIHVDQLKACECDPLKRPENYWLMAQTGDETLDYRHAVKKYAACKQLIEQGGDHSFQYYEKWLPKIIEFLEQ